MAFIKFDGGYYEGETRFGVPDGEGSAYYDNGNYYHGQWSNGKYYGKGKYVNSDGPWYEGEFFYNDMHGKGTYYCANGNRYEGIFKDDHIVSGTVYYYDGYKYTGTFDEGWYEHGEGEMCYPNGNRYKGQFQHGKCNGEGTFYYANGDRFKGQWKNDKANGECTYYYATGATKRGRFVDDKENGTFVFDYPFVKIKVKIEFEDGKQVSKAIYYDYDGKPIDTKSVCFNNSISSYVGEIKDGKRHGKGMLWFNDGRCYVGKFENDEAHGNGTMYHKSGNRYVSKWNHGVVDGRGVWYYTNGTKRLAKYENGKQIYLGEVIDANEDFAEDKDAAKNKASSSKTNKPTANKTQTTSLAKPVSQSSEKKSKKNKYDIVEGVATFEYPEGKYEGKRYYGKRGGFGTMYYHDGSYYVGGWEKDKMHGEGKMYFPKTIVRKNRNGSEIKFEKGSRIEGIWKNSNNGKKMTLILSDGTRKNIRFSHGNFILK